MPAFHDRLEGRENDRFDNGLENGVRIGVRIGVRQYIAGEDHDNLSSSLTGAVVWALRLLGVPSNDYRIQRSLRGLMARSFTRARAPTHAPWTRRPRSSS